MKKRLKLKKKVSNFIKFVVSICLIFAIFFVSPFVINTYKEEKKVKEERALKVKIAKENKEKYDKCILEYNEDIKNNEEIINIEKYLNNYLNKYNISVKYTSLTNNYEYKYQETKVYYGASLIKIVDVLYLIDNKVDLNDTVTYTKDYVKNGSSETAKRTLGDKITLKELITYVLKVSDNSAHFMLTDYIGKDKLKAYGKNLGAKNILTNADIFGNQTAYDTTIYLKRMYEILKDSNNSFIKESMINMYVNKLFYQEPNNVAHKYGLYSSYYHDIAIVYDEYPYAISILSISKETERNELFSNIAKKINELNEKYISLTKDSCYKKVYGG